MDSVLRVTMDVRLATWRLSLAIYRQLVGFVTQLFKSKTLNLNPKTWLF